MRLLLLVVVSRLMYEIEANRLRPDGHAHRYVDAFITQLLAWAPSWQISRTTVVDGSNAVVISNFLPPNMASDWYQQLNTSWSHAAPCRESEDACKSGSSAVDLCSWLYTTNSNGGNRKIRSVFQREERRKGVEDMYRRHAFSYSKWELSAGTVQRLKHPVNESSNHPASGSHNAPTPTAFASQHANTIN